MGKMKVRIDESVQCLACNQKKQTNAFNWTAHSGFEINLCFECVLKVAEVARKIEDEYGMRR